jgi:glycosyltransferase involved in cell wall biosynthesis
MRVSVLCPTHGREPVHARLYATFAAQTHPNIELVVHDDNPSPSGTFSTLTDPRVRYHQSAQRLSVGEKRNWLARHATGEILVHFDDDDHYGPDYVERMLAALGDADLVKLSGFYLYSLTHQVFAYWDQTVVSPVHFRLQSGRAVEPFFSDRLSAEERAIWGRKNLLGFGFSYVYRRSLWERIPFPDLSHGEDCAFVEACIAAGARITTIPDRGSALVLRHAGDHSILFPQYLLPPHLVGVVFGSAIAERLGTRGL